MIRLQQQLLLLSGCANWAAAQDVECPEDSMRQPAPAATLIWPDLEGDTRTCSDLTVVLPYFSPWHVSVARGEPGGPGVGRWQPGTSQPPECQSPDDPPSDPTQFKSDCDYPGCDQPDGCTVNISGSWCFDSLTSDRYDTTAVLSRCEAYRECAGGSRTGCVGCREMGDAITVVEACEDQPTLASARQALEDRLATELERCAAEDVEARCGGCGISCYVHIMHRCCGGMKDGWSAWGDGCGSYNKDECDYTLFQYLPKNLPVFVIACVCVCGLCKLCVTKRPVETASLGPTDSAATMQSPLERLNNRCREPWKAGYRPDWPCWKMVLFIVLCAGLIVAIGFGLLITFVFVALSSGRGLHGRPFIVDGRALVAELTDDGSSDWWTPVGEL
eukprot:SAG22_NODE_616_length_8539_cov_5.330213_6_plen_389_part_00